MTDDDMGPLGDIANEERVARGQRVLQMYDNAATDHQFAVEFLNLIQLGQLEPIDAYRAWKYALINIRTLNLDEQSSILCEMLKLNRPFTTAFIRGMRQQTKDAIRRRLEGLNCDTKRVALKQLRSRRMGAKRLRGPATIESLVEGAQRPLMEGEQPQLVPAGFFSERLRQRRRRRLDQALRESVEEAAAFGTEEEMQFEPSPFVPAPVSIEGIVEDFQQPDFTAPEPAVSDLPEYTPPAIITMPEPDFPQPISIEDLLPPLEVVVPEQLPLPESTVKIEPDLPPPIPPREIIPMPELPSRPSDSEQQYITTITNMTNTINTLRNQAAAAQQVSQVCENRVTQLQDEKRDLEVNIATLRKQYDLCMLEKTVAKQEAERERERRIEKEQWANNALSRASTSGSDKEAQCEQEIRSLQGQITDKNKTIEDMQQSSVDRQKTIGDLSSALQLSQDKIKSLQKDLDDEKAKRRSKMGPQPTFDACCEKLSDKIKDVIEKLDSLVQTKLEEKFYEEQVEEGEGRLLEDRLRRLRGEPSVFPEVPSALAGNGSGTGTGNCLTTPHFNRYTSALERWAQSVNEMLKDIKKEVKKIEKKEDKECPPTFSAEDIQKVMAKLAFLRSTLIEQGIRSGPVSDAVGAVVDAFSDARFSRLQGAGSRPVTAVEVEALLQQYKPPAPVIEQQQNCVTPADLSQAVNNILNAFAGVIVNQQQPPPPPAMGLGGPVPQKCTVVANGLMNALCRINGIRPKLIAAAKECDPVAYQQFLNQRKAERKPYVRNCDLIRFIYGVNSACVRKLAVEAGIFQNKKEIEFE